MIDIVYAREKKSQFLNMDIFTNSCENNKRLNRREICLFTIKFDNMPKTLLTKTSI